ncbi:MAG: metalloregulator ArsR/SmtB family transcription factor [Terriglobales bacterium]
MRLNAGPAERLFATIASHSLTFFDESGTVVVDTAVPATTKCRTANCCPETKSAKITESRAKEYAGCFKALADPMRIRILNLLANNDEPVCVCEIVKHFPIQQPSISHHLKILRNSRFVLAERRGTFMYYQVNRKCLAEFPHAARVILNV